MIELDRKKHEYEPRPQWGTGLRALDDGEQPTREEPGDERNGECSVRPTRNTGVVTRIGTPPPWTILSTCS